MPRFPSVISTIVTYGKNYYRVSAVISAAAPDRQYNFKVQSGRCYLFVAPNNEQNSLQATRTLKHYRVRLMPITLTLPSCGELFRWVFSLAAWVWYISIFCCCMYSNVAQGDIVTIKLPIAPTNLTTGSLDEIITVEILAKGRYHGHDYEEYFTLYGHRGAFVDLKEWSCYTYARQRSWLYRGVPTTTERVKAAATDSFPHLIGWLVCDAAWRLIRYCWSKCTAPAQVTYIINIYQPVTGTPSLRAAQPTAQLSGSNEIGPHLPMDKIGGLQGDALGLCNRLQPPALAAVPADQTQHTVSLLNSSSIVTSYVSTSSSPEWRLIQEQLPTAAAPLDSGNLS